MYTYAKYYIGTIGSMNCASYTHARLYMCCFRLFTVCVCMCVFDRKEKLEQNKCENR